MSNKRILRKTSLFSLLAARFFQHPSRSYLPVRSKQMKALYLFVFLLGAALGPVAAGTTPSPFEDKSLLIFFTNTVSAQKVWTLEECITYALNNNIQVKQQQLNTTISKLEYHQKIASLFPSVNGSATLAYNNGQTVDMYTNQFASQTIQSDNFSLSANMVLFDGLQLLNGLKQKQIDWASSAQPDVFRGVENTGIKQQCVLNLSISSGSYL